MLSFINYPTWLKPEVFGFLAAVPESAIKVINVLLIISAVILVLLLPLYYNLFIKSENSKTKPKAKPKKNNGLMIFLVCYLIFFVILLIFKIYPLIRWYGVSYIVGLTIGYLLTMHLLKTEDYKTLNKKLIDDLYFYGVIGLVLGGRIFYCLVYEPQYFLHKPLEIIIPFKDGQFSGFSGMSYHGALLGCIIVGVVFAYVKKIDLRELCDLIFPVIPLGYTLGRIANFINQELYGRITASPVGMLFPDAERLPLKLHDVQNVITKLGWVIDQQTQTVKDSAGKIIDNVLAYSVTSGQQLQVINLPRHPSQLYEACCEGLILFFIMWFPARIWKPFKGFLASAYLAGYGIARILLEFFRQPDNQFENHDADKYVGYIFGNFTMGQILSYLMLLAAVGFGVYFYILSKNDSPLQDAAHNKKK
jgi:phosphatidylglycerol---prolipoprotein diacylglyceryl transferase